MLLSIILLSRCTYNFSTCILLKMIGTRLRYKFKSFWNPMYLTEDRLLTWKIILFARISSLESRRAGSISRSPQRLLIALKKVWCHYFFTLVKWIPIANRCTFIAKQLTKCSWRVNKPWSLMHSQRTYYLLYSCLTLMKIHEKQLQQKCMNTKILTLGRACDCVFVSTQDVLQAGNNSNTVINWRVMLFVQKQ